MLNAIDIIALDVYSPTPGNCINFSKDFGNLPLKSLRILIALFFRFLALE